MFKVNEGPIDRTIRIILGIILIVAGFLTSGIVSIILWVIGAISLFTGIIGFCALYMIFGINTCPVKKGEKDNNQK